MVDPEPLAALLRRLDGEVASLRRRADEGEEAALLADEERLSGLKHRFVTALETVIDVAQHLAASERWPVPASNADSLRQLGRQRVVAALDDVGDLEAFSVAVARWAIGPVPLDP